MVNKGVHVCACSQDVHRLGGGSISHPHGHTHYLHEWITALFISLIITRERKKSCWKVGYIFSLLLWLPSPLFIALHNYMSFMERPLKQLLMSRLHFVINICFKGFIENAFNAQIKREYRRDISYFLSATLPQCFIQTSGPNSSAPSKESSVSLNSCTRSDGFWYSSHTAE